MAGEIHFARNWWALALISPLSAAMLAIGLLFTYPAVEAAAARQSLPVSYQWWFGLSVKTGSSWWTVMAFALLMVVTAAGLYWEPVVSLLTVFTEEGVGQPGLLKRKFIPWPEITQVRYRGARVTVRSRRTKIGFNLFLFSDRDKVLEEIAGRVPPAHLSLPSRDRALGDSR